MLFSSTQVAALAVRQAGGSTCRQTGKWQHWQTDTMQVAALADTHAVDESGEDEEEEVEDVCEEDWGVATTGQNNKHPTRRPNYMNNYMNCLYDKHKQHGRARETGETADDGPYHVISCHVTVSNKRTS
jgi:hypothetical protein